MPIVPVVPKVRAAGLTAPNVGVDASGAFGEGVARGLQQVGGDVQQVGSDMAREARDERQKADATLTSNALSQLQDDTTTSTDDAKEGFIPNAVGMDAAKRSGGVYERFDKKRQQLAESLANEDQRAMFDMHAAQMRDQLRHRVEGHVSQQNKVAEVASVNGLAATTLKAIANNYADDALVADQSAMVEARIRQTSLPGEDAEAKAAKWKAEVVKARLNQYRGADDLDGMQSLFSRAKSELGEESETYQAQITLMKQRKDADRTALDVVSAHRMRNSFVNEGAARAAFEALPEAKRTKEAVAAFNGWMEQEKARERDVKGTYFERALEAFNGRHLLRDIAPEDADWIQHNDSPTWEALQNRQQSWVAHWKANSQQKPGKTLAQIAAYGDLLKQIETDPTRFSGMTSAQFVHDWGKVLHEDDLQKGVVKWADLSKQKNDKGPKSGTETMRVTKDIFRNEMGLTGPHSSDEATWTPEQNSVFAKVVDYVDEQEAAFKKANPNKPTTMEMRQQWAREKLAKGVVPGDGFWPFKGDQEVTRAEFESNPKYSGKQFIDKAFDAEELDPGNLPDPALEGAKRLLKARGLPETTQNIREVMTKLAKGLKQRGVAPSMEHVSALILQNAPPPTQQAEQQGTPNLDAVLGITPTTDGGTQ